MPHAWLVEDLPGGRVRILTQETQFGRPAAALAEERPNPMLNGHQAWLDGLVRAASGKAAGDQYAHRRCPRYGDHGGRGGPQPSPLGLLLACRCSVGVWSRYARSRTTCEPTIPAPPVTFTFVFDAAGILRVSRPAVVNMWCALVERRF